MAMNVASETHTTTAAHQVTPRIAWWTQSRRRTSANTSSVTKQRLDDGHVAVVEGHRLEDEGGGEGDPAEEPEGVVEEVAHEAPALRVGGVPDAGHVLGDDVQCVRQRSQEGEQHRHRGIVAPGGTERRDPGCRH